MIWFRRACQFVILLVFLYLFLQTGFIDGDRLRLPVNVFLKFDPLVFISASLSARTIVVPALFSLILVGLAVVFGRFFCGWICPLGTILNLVGLKRRKILPRTFKFYFLIFLLSLALIGIQVTGLFDPFCIFIRSMTLTIFPAADKLMLRPVFGEFRFLPVEPQNFRLGIFTLIFFFAILLVSIPAAGFWCRSICPLGALYGFVSGFSRIRRNVAETCTHCGECRQKCHMDAIGEDCFSTDKADCTLCLKCSAVCPVNAVTFTLKSGPEAANDIKAGLTRRQLIFSVVGAGLFYPVVKYIKPGMSYGILRPPGAGREKLFLEKCVRCGECMKVCPNTALQPALLESGLEGIYSPMFRMRESWCEYNCNLCGQVCPTGAIPALPIEKKRKTPIGIAEIHKDLCFPWAYGTNCAVCEEHCPVPDKAIKLTEKKGIRYPSVDPALCVGCGICEAKCPAESAAIRVYKI